MQTTRRDLLKLASLAAAGSLLTPAFSAYANELKGVGKAAKPLNILILGGTGFTGPFQVAYALARGHKVTLLIAASGHRRNGRARSNNCWAIATTI